MWTQYAANVVVPTSNWPSGGYLRLDRVFFNNVAMSQESLTLLMIPHSVNQNL